VNLRAYFVAVTLFGFGLAQAQTTQLVPAPAIATDTQNVENQSQKENSSPQPSSTVAPKLDTAPNKPKAAADADTGKGKSNGPIEWVSILLDKGRSDPIAVLTVALVFFAGYQALLTRDTARRQLRAYIVVKDNIVTGMMQVNAEGSRKISIATVYTNKGQTPAYDVKIITKLKILTADEAEKFDFKLRPLADSSITTLGQDESANASVVMEVCPKPDFDEIWAANNKRLFIYGIIEYRDVFGKLRYTRLCDNFIPELPKLVATPYKTGHKST